MHDIAGRAVVDSRPDLPIYDMSKADSVIHDCEDPAMDSGASAGGTEAVDSRKEGKDPGVYSTPKIPQPVTPESQKADDVNEPEVNSPNTENKGSAESPGVPSSARELEPASPPASQILKTSKDSKSKGNSGLSSARNRERSAEGNHKSEDHEGKHKNEGRRRNQEGCSSENRRESRDKRSHYDDASSSDDDSYFASNMPTPKSGRSFSYSSAGSAHAATSPMYPNSDDLSFSDESDDEMNQQPGVHISHMIQPKGAVADMHLYPQRITRMHSVSSLVSSSDESGDRPRDRTMSASTMSSHTSTGSDPNLRAELDAAGDGRPASHLSEVSGRRSPVMGHHASPGYLYASPSPGAKKQSPPPIMQGYIPPPGMLHPQPQPMTQDQMSAWMSAGNTAQAYQAGKVMHGYGSTLQTPAQGFTPQGGFHNVGDNGNTIPFVYSEDNETGVVGFPNINQMAGGPSSGGQPQFPTGGKDGDGQGLQQKQMPQGNSGSGGFQNGGGVGESSAAKGALAHGDSGLSGGGAGGGHPQDRSFQVYWQRWIMLFYMSVLNLLSDWTCYSVAPIALLTEKAFGDIDPEKLVVVFLGANAISTAAEPIILSRLGLRRTVLFGALLLMIGSIVKSGGVPPILKSDMVMGHDEWRLYLGFFLVGLSQPLYQCTPALLSASWFPEVERTMATGVALNANQLGIGCAFIFGTLLVAEAEDIIPYFGLLSTISTIVFLGTLIQFDDAPPTPPSSSARVMRGTLAVNLPSIGSIVQSVREFGGGTERPNQGSFGASAAAPSPAASYAVGKADGTSTSQETGSARRRAKGSRSQKSNADSCVLVPSPARDGRTADVVSEILEMKQEAERLGFDAPSPAMQGRVGTGEGQGIDGTAEPGADSDGQNTNQNMGENPMYPGQPGGPPPLGMAPPFGVPAPYQYPYWDPLVQQQMQQQQQAYYQQHYYYLQQQAQQQAQQQPSQLPPQLPPPPYMYPPPPMAYPNHLQGYDVQQAYMQVMSDSVDEGAEPIVTITPHHLDIDIRDDQVIRSLRACFARPGFIHSLVAFTVSGIVINTLSTYMDYLVRLNGAPRYYTGVVGGSFQFLIMVSSLIIGKQTDKTRAYYSVSMAMLVLGAFGLAECGVSLDSNRGSDLRYSLLVVAVLVGPLQPVSTELGVDVVYPLSENTVLVIQQLFSNLLSALFIPIFKMLKDVGASEGEQAEMYERPQYTFSFYLLIVLHTGATVFFATFNGKYLRYEHELQKKAQEEQEDLQNANAFHPFYNGADERQPLVQNTVV